ncbi:MAG: hypothetical protein JWO12_1721 [Frankiales bacterium]|nr:hypothetical protein [Frankiales bacterium]
MTLGQRLESSALGQALLSLLMIVVVGCVLLWNLPAGRPHDAVRPAIGPLVQAVGLEQDWALFAPDPRGFSVGVYATVTHAGGRTERWQPPHNGLLVAPYRTYRWQKYVERLRADDYSGLWEPTARWIARRAGKDVTRVVLTRTFQDAAEPGSGQARPRAGSYDFYTLDLP